MKRIAAVIIVALLTTTAIFVESCHAGAGTSVVDDTGCTGGSRSGNACNSGGLTWVYYRMVPEKSKVPDQFVFPTSSWRTAYTQGKSTIVGCNEGFWMLAYDILQANEKEKDTLYNVKDGNKTYQIKGIEYGLGQDLRNYGTGNSDWHRSIVNRVLGGDIDHGTHGAKIFNESANKPCSGAQDATCNGGIYTDHNGNKKHFSTFISDYYGEINANKPTFSEIQWRYTESGAHGQTGSRALKYLDDKGLSRDTYIKVPSGSPAFELGKNYVKFATAMKYGTIDQVKHDFNSVADLWKKLTYYDENGQQIFFNHGKGKESMPYPKTADEAFNMISYFCFDDGTTDPYTATFTGKSEVKVSGSWKDGKDNSIEIAAGSYTVEFQHTVTRTDNNNEGKVEERYWKRTGNGSWPKGGGWSSTYEKSSLSKGKTATTTNSETISLGYGESKKVCSSIWYYKKIPISKDKVATYNDNNGGATSDACITVRRKSAEVDPVLRLNVWNDNETTDDSKKLVSNYDVGTRASNTDYGTVTITHPDGQYYVRFARRAKRAADGAGGNVSVSWSGTATGRGTVSGTKSYAEGDDAQLGDNAANAWAGYLKYGESKKLCASVTITYGSTSKSINNYCVTIYREPLKCTFGTTTKDVTYAAGENFARIGVINFTAKGKTSGDVSSIPESDYTWTGIEGTSIGQVKKSIWARPGDQIGFKYEMCGGALYPMAVNKYSFTENSNGTYSVGTKNTPTYSDFTFVVSGKMDRYANLTTVEHTFDKKKDGTDGYLFGDTLSTPGTTAYSNTKTYTGHFSTSGFTGTDFLQYNNSTNTFNITKTAYSPSVSNNSNYSCFITGASAVSGKRYQINGKSNEDGHQCGILRSDVGGVIYQTITYNPVKFASSTATNTSTTRTVTAQVFTPYNYLIKPYVNNLSSGVVYLGETMTVGPGVYVQPRVNSGIPNGGTSGSATGGYATMTKPTERQSKVYRIRNGDRTQLSESPVTTGLIFNKDGNLNGATSDDDQINIELTDDGDTYQVGDQICVEVSYYPADSHDWPEHGTQDIIKSTNPDPASKEGTSSQPAMYKTSSLARDKGTVTATACSTIAKRPTMSVESANAYSATKFDTGLFSKKFSTTGASYLFGSWSEYGVFGKVETGTGGKTSYFASGAALGYATNARTSSAVNSTRSNTDSTHTASSSITSSNRQCIFSTQTFVNIDSTGNCTSSSDKINGTSASDYSDAMKDYFGKISTEKNTLTDQERGETVTVNDKNYVNLLKSDIKNHLASNSGVYEFKLNGNAYLNGSHSLPDDAGNNRTIVYNISGDLVIDGNINYEVNQTKTSLNDNTGVVILAKNVWITGNPDYINAMIIADQVNTCKFDSEGAVSLSTLNSDRCNKQLVFDAPVMTKKIVLNRTYGGGKGESSIQRAEIFNLNMANYLWSFNQMQNYNQAVTTYSREMPSRY